MGGKWGTASFLLVAFGSGVREPVCRGSTAALSLPLAHIITSTVDNTVGVNEPGLVQDQTRVAGGRGGSLARLVSAARGNLSRSLAQGCCSLLQGAGLMEPVC
jgi:hypothetical protein